MRNGEGLQPYRSFSVLPFRPDSKVDVRVRARSSPSKDRMQIVRPVPLAVRRREHANGDVQPSHVSAGAALPVFRHAPICTLARVFTVRCVEYFVRKPRALRSRAVQALPHVVETRREKKKDEPCFRYAMSK